MDAHYAPMLEVGYLHIDNPIAVISSHNQSDFNNAAGLLLLDGFDLDEVPLEEMQASLETISQKARERNRSLWTVRHLFQR